MNEANGTINRDENGNICSITFFPGKAVRKVRCGNRVWDVDTNERDFNPRQFTRSDCAWHLVGETMVIVCAKSSESMFDDAFEAKIDRAVKAEQNRQGL